MHENIRLKICQEAAQVDQWFAFYKTQTITIAQTPLVKTLDWQVMEAYLNTEVARLHPVVNDAVFAKPDGTYYFTGMGLVEGKTIADRPYFITAMTGQIVVSEPIISRASGVQKVNIVVPISDSQMPQGLFSMGIKIDSIRAIIKQFSRDLTQDLVQPSNQHPESYVFVLDALGRAIVHLNQALIYNQD